LLSLSLSFSLSSSSDFLLHSSVCCSLFADGSVGGSVVAAAATPSMLIFQKYLCAASAASFAETLTMPLDTTRVRMQLAATPGVQHGMIATAKSIVSRDGLHKLYVGLTPAVLRQAIVGGVGVGIYPQIKDLFVHVQKREQHVSLWSSAESFVTGAPAPPTSAAAKAAAASELSFGTKVLAGATSGVIGQAIAAPTCVVKVRLQADARLAVPRYRGTWHAFQTIPAVEGWRALFRGIVPSLQRAAFMYGATISTYDHVKHEIVTRLYAGDGAAMDRVSTHVMASSVSGLVASLVSTPFGTSGNMHFVIALHAHEMLRYPLAVAYVDRSLPRCAMFLFSSDTIKTRIIAQPVMPRKPLLGPFPSMHARAAAVEAVSKGTATAATGPGSTINFATGASHAAVVAGAHLPAPLYSSTIDCVAKTIRHEGLAALCTSRHNTTLRCALVRDWCRHCGC
jgi:hypothetical protein